MNISFDFDSTISQLNWDLFIEEGIDEFSLIESTLEEIKKHYNRGDELFIITTRGEPGRESLLSFLREHNLSKFFGDRIFLTKGKRKHKTLDKLKINIHFDDDTDELLWAESHNCKTKIILV